MFQPRYAEIATFMRAPLVRDPSEVDIALIGVPFDGGVTNRPGARHGPREIRNMSTLMRAVHHVTKVDPYALCRIGDMGDVAFSRIYELEACLDDIAEFYGRVHAAAKWPSEPSNVSLSGYNDAFRLRSRVPAACAARGARLGPIPRRSEIDGPETWTRAL